MEDKEFSIELRQQADYVFETQFEGTGVPPLITDEPPPLGGDAGPNPSRLLTLAVANCLSASLLFAMRKFKNEPGPLRTRATTAIERNAENRWRIGRIAVDIQLGRPAAEMKLVDRILAQFEEFCIVTQSVRAAFPVTVRVLDHDGTPLTS